MLSLPKWPPACPSPPPHAPSPSSEWFWGEGRRGWFPPRRDHRPQYPRSSLIVGKASPHKLPTRRGKELVHFHHTGSCSGQFISLSPPVGGRRREEKGDSEVQLCLCHQGGTTMFSQEPIYSTVRRIGGRGGKHSVSYRHPNISVLYLFQGEGRPGEVVREAGLVWKTGQEELTDTDPRRPHQDLADKPGLLTEDSVLKTLASRYQRCQYWVTVSRLPIMPHISTISDPHWARAVECPPPWPPSCHVSTLSTRDIPRVHMPRYWQPADPACDGRNDKWQVFHHEPASLLSCWSWQE